MSTSLKILTSPNGRTPTSGPATHQEGQLGNYVELRSHSPRPCGRRVAVDVVLGSLPKMPT
eukprot:2151710-Prymnesium_polylepis.1